MSIAAVIALGAIAPMASQAAERTVVGGGHDGGTTLTCERALYDRFPISNQETPFLDEVGTLHNALFLRTQIEAGARYYEDQDAVPFEQILTEATRDVSENFFDTANLTCCLPGCTLPPCPDFCCDVPFPPFEPGAAFWNSLFAELPDSEPTADRVRQRLATRCDREGFDQCVSLNAFNEARDLLNGLGERTMSLAEFNNTLVEMENDLVAREDLPLERKLAPLVMFAVTRHSVANNVRLPGDPDADPAGAISDVSEADLKGAATGASIGSAAGPWGTIIGGVVGGAALSLVEANTGA
jgi:hypothetical protein